MLQSTMDNSFQTNKEQLPLYHGLSVKPVTRQKKSLLLVSFVIVFIIIRYFTRGFDSLVTIHSQIAGCRGEWCDLTTGSNGSAPLQSKYAYATFLTNTSDPIQDAHYLEALRILFWQLKIAPETRSPANLPIVVLCTDTVAEDHREQLKVWGADLVLVVEPENSSWLKPGQPRWQDGMTKIRLHDFTQFDKLLFMDADTILNRPLDDVFLEAEAEEQVTLKNEVEIGYLDAALPAHYVFAAFHDNAEYHHWPPVSHANGDFTYASTYLNAGFYIIKPDPGMLRYYRSLVIIEDRFPASMLEQDLFNYAHRQEGNMPWMVLNYTWNTRVPMLKDLEGGCASFHEKWWAPFDPEMAPWIDSIRNRVLQYYGEIAPDDIPTIG